MQLRQWARPLSATVFAAVLQGPFFAATAFAQEDDNPLVLADEPTTFAYNYGENETTRTAGMAGAARATGHGTSALFVNPANMVQTRIYHIGAMAQVTPEYNRQVYGGAIVDSVTSRLAGGIAVHGGFLDPDGIDRSWLDVRLGLAYPIADALYVGFSGRYLKVTQDALGVLGESRASGGLRDPEGGRFAFVNVPTFDAGVTIRAAESLFFGVAGQNLSFPDNGLLPTTFGGGAGFVSEGLTIEVDGLADFNSYESTSARIMGGAEYVAAGHVPLRAGYRFDQGAESHALSGGLGYIANEFSAELSVRRTIAGPSSTMIFIGLAYFLESSGLTRGPAAF
jgi:hypothetical protein